MRSTIVTFAIMAAAVLVAAPAMADEGDCSPRCREGYACVAGRCASPCNPACGPGEVCTRGGTCLPTAPPSPPQPPAPPPTPQWQPAADPGTLHFDQERDRARYERRRAAGVGLIIVGGIMGTVAGVLIALGDETGMVVGYILAPAELAFVIPGIALTVVGAKGMARIDKGMPVSLGLRLHLARAPTDPYHADADRSASAPSGVVLTAGLTF